MTAFVFDRNYDNLEQVAPFLPDFERVCAELAARGAYRYNDRFIGRIPGIIGPSEGTGIYLLQGLKDARDQAVKVAQLIADGYEPITTLIDKLKVRRVVLYSTERRGAWAEWADARIIPDKDGNARAILPKGAVTRGYLVGARSVLALR